MCTPAPTGAGEACVAQGENDSLFLIQNGAACTTGLQHQFEYICTGGGAPNGLTGCFVDDHGYAFCPDDVCVRDTALDVHCSNPPFGWSCPPGSQPGLPTGCMTYTSTEFCCSAF
jgi:hypothetical protein